VRDFARLASTLWTGRTGRQLRGDFPALTLAPYLIGCGNANVIGLYYLPLPTLCHELGMPEQMARDALARLAAPSVEFAFYDLDEEVVWLPAGPRYQLGCDVLSPGDKRGPAVVREAVRYAGCRFFWRFMERWSEALRIPPEVAGRVATRSEGASAERDGASARQEGHAGLASKQERSEAKQEQEQERVVRAGARAVPVVMTEYGSAPIPAPSSPEAIASLERDLALKVPELVEARPKRGRPKTDPVKPPLPFTIGAALEAVRAAAPDRFAFDSRLIEPFAKGITNLIRKGVTLDEFALFGEWLAAGGNGWIEGEIGPSWIASGRFGDDLAKARQWADRGKPAIERSSRPPPRRVTVPAASAADFAKGGPDEF
jgi:hypothetical protein